MPQNKLHLVLHVLGIAEFDAKMGIMVAKYDKMDRGIKEW